MAMERKYIKPFIHQVIGFSEFNKMKPAMAGKCDKINACGGNRCINRHGPKYSELLIASRREKRKLYVFFGLGNTELFFISVPEGVIEIFRTSQVEPST
jgi:hypothetical protein